MNQSNRKKTAPFDTQYFPLNIALLTVGENMLPIGNWTSVPILYLSLEDFATLGERCRYQS